MKIILFLALITLATCELYHYQECVRGTTVLLKEPCSSGTYEGNSPFHPLADNKFAQLEEAAGSFAKGMTGVVNRANRTKVLFSDVFGMVMTLRSKRLGDEELQGKCIQFMHRMVEV